MNSNQIKTSNTILYRLKFSIEGSLNDFVELHLFNGYGDMISNSYKFIDLSLPMGIYKIHIYSNETFEQKIIILDKNVNEIWHNKGSYSSIPDRFLQSSQDYYFESYKNWSKKYTDNNQLSKHDDSSILVYFRYPSSLVKQKENRTAKSMGWRFSLIDGNRRNVCHFSQDNLKENILEGWMVFHIKLPAGLYYICYKGSKQREIPIQIFPQWQTQFFITFKRTPIFETARIQIVKLGNVDSSTDVDNLQLDTLLRNIDNGNYFIPETMIQKAIYNKWHNPMLAIAVCYAYLLSQRNDYDDQFKIVVKNLEDRILITDSPDLKIIKLLLAVHCEERIPVVEIDKPCMLSIGLKSVINQNIKYPNKVKITGLCEIIIKLLKSDIIWTSYSPLKNNSKEIRDLCEADNEDSEGFDYETLVLYEADQIGYGRKELLESRENVAKTIPEDWLSQSIVAQLSSDTKKTYSIKELARQFQVSKSIVYESLKDIKKVVLVNDDTEFSPPSNNISRKDFFFLKKNLQNIDDDH